MEAQEEHEITNCSHCDGNYMELALCNDDVLRTFERNLCVWGGDRVERGYGVTVEEKTCFLIVLARSHKILVSG